MIHPAQKALLWKGTSYFPVAMIKYPVKSKLMSKRTLWLTVGEDMADKNNMVAGAGSWSVLLHPYTGSTEKKEVR